MYITPNDPTAWDRAAQRRRQDVGQLIAIHGREKVIAAFEQTGAPNVYDMPMAQWAAFVAEVSR